MGDAALDLYADDLENADFQVSEKMADRRHRKIKMEISPHIKIVFFREN